MDALVKRMKDYYEANPYFQYRAEFGVTYILDKAEVERLRYWPENRKIDYTYKLKPLLDPVSPQRLEIAEQKLGFKIPSLLAELYMEICNGGFGPRIFGLDENGWQDGLALDNAVGMYLSHRQLCYKYGSSEQWNKLLKGLLPISNGGCVYYYMLDCRTDNGPVLRWASNGLDEKLGWDLTAASLREWLEKWLDNQNESLSKHLFDDELSEDDIPF